MSRQRRPMPEYITRTAAANLLAAFIATSFRDPMFVREPLDRVVTAEYIKRRIDIFDATEQGGHDHRYHFMIFRIVVDQKDREFSMETLREGQVTEAELKRAAQSFAASYATGAE